MKSDFEMIVHKFQTEIKIYPIGDVHIGTNGCLLQEFKDLIEKIASEENSYAVIIGDMLDNGIKSGKGLGVYEQTMRPSEQRRFLAEQLRPIKDKILAVISGNHEKRSTKECDENPLYEVCCKLDIEDLYRENLAVVKIQLGNRNDGGKIKRQSYILLLHHGKGSNNSAVKKDKDFISNFEGADAIITGHVHEGHICKISKKIIDAKNNKILDRNQAIIICNSFLKDAPYGIEGMLGTTNHEIINFDLCLGKKKIKTHF